jgi:hypothetical protein
MKFRWFQKLWRPQREAELDAEIRSHLDEAIRDRLARGESPEQARANALREFGNVGLVKEVTREMWGWAALERLGQDLRFVSSLTHRHNRLASEWHSARPAYCGEARCAGGCNSSRSNDLRRLITPGRFNSSAAIVARPVGVRPMSVRQSGCQAKCSRQLS